LQARKPRDFSDPPNLFDVLDGDYFDLQQESGASAAMATVFSGGHP